MKAEGHPRKVIAERFGCNPNYVTNAHLAHRRKIEAMEQAGWRQGT
jgi:DNA-binding CsgD family transcriptional regulator